ncbi:MAG: hypothetical protein NTV93_00850 [Verrucomicrobia bacterium]|nr:hypothetical protein [Verrucomicrobiota bacterium]
MDRLTALGREIAREEDPARRHFASSYPVGVLVDRFRPFVVAIGGMVLLIAGQLLYMPLFIPACGPAAFPIMGAAVVVTTVGLSVFQGAAMPLHMYVLPAKQYGQFCGSLAMLNALSSMAGGLVAGTITAGIIAWFGQKASWAFAPVGQGGALLLCLAALIQSLRLWNRDYRGTMPM